MVYALIDVATVTWAPVNEELGLSFALLKDSYAAGAGALAIGAIILVPFAIKLGRRPVYVLSTAMQCGLSVWLARMQNVADLMGANILTCFVGALAEVLVQMTVADMYFIHQRGLANTIYYWVMMVGTTLSTVAGGYIVSSQGWRWVWWWLVILLGAGFIVFLFLYDETVFLGSRRNESATRQLSEKKDSDLPTVEEIPRVEEEPANLATNVDIDYSIPKKTFWQRLALWTISPLPWGQAAKHGYRPLVILLSFPPVFFMAFEYGFFAACTTVPTTTLSAVMPLPPYNFSPRQIGLMSLPRFIGVSLAVLSTGPISDRFAIFIAGRNGGIFEPEMRLWLVLAFIPLVPAGLFMFGIGLYTGSHWLLIAFGLGISSFGVVPASSAALTYLTDGYTDVYLGRTRYSYRRLTCCLRSSPTRWLGWCLSGISSPRSLSLRRHLGSIGSDSIGFM